MNSEGLPVREHVLPIAVITRTEVASDSDVCVFEQLGALGCSPAWMEGDGRKAFVLLVVFSAGLLCVCICVMVVMSVLCSIAAVISTVISDKTMAVANDRG
jgi:uncharacterized membrane protein